MRRPLARSLVLGRPGLFYGSAVRDYLDRVRAADGDGLSRGVTNAINTYISGLITAQLLGTSGGVISQAASTIKAHCVLAGANTLDGALVPVVGPAPTNVNFVAGDYNRKLGLGDPTNVSKYLDSNRSNNVDPQDSKHLSAYTSTSIGTANAMIGSVIRTPTTSATQITYNAFGSVTATVNGGTSIEVSIGNPIGFFGVARNGATSQQLRINATNTASSIASNGNHNQNILVFARTDAGAVNQYCIARIRAYSIGEFVDLAILRSLQDQLFAALNAAIP